MTIVWMLLWIASMLANVILIRAVTRWRNLALYWKSSAEHWCQLAEDGRATTRSAIDLAKRAMKDN